MRLAGFGRWLLCGCRWSGGSVHQIAVPVKGACDKLIDGQLDVLFALGSAQGGVDNGWRFALTAPGLAVCGFGACGTFKLSGNEIEKRVNGAQRSVLVMLMIYLLYFEIQHFHFSIK